MPYESRTYMRHVDAISARDLETLRRKDAEYGGSWLRRGGVGAFMMLARKFDRIEEQSKRVGYDIIAAALAAPEKEGLLDDIADLRVYLMLVEAEVRERMDAKERCPSHPSDTCYSKLHGYYCRKCGWHELPTLPRETEIIAGVDGKNPPQVPRFNVTEQEHPFGYDPDQDG